MINTVLIDDERHCLETLNILIREYCPRVKIEARCASAREGLAAIHTFNPALVFLDIEMPVMNGFELLEQFEKIPFALIFTTSFDQYAIKAIRFSALDYLLKPIDSDELILAIKKVEEQRHLPLPEQFQILLSRIDGSKKKFNKIAVPTAEGFELIPNENVIYLRADDNYTRLYLKNGVKIIACRTLKEMQEQIKEFPLFVRVHHSFMVNLNEIIRYVRGDGGYLVMSDGSTVSVSRSRKEALLRFF